VKHIGHKPDGKGNKERRAELCGLCPYCRINRGCNGGKRRARSDKYKCRRKGR
jgi:hypothetical protein